MSMHKIPLTHIERTGLVKHGLDVDTPSQLSDGFRQGVAHGLEHASALIRELEAAKEDAERYQWLRNYLISTDTSHDDDIINASSHVDFDVIIDAAIQAEGKQA